MADRELIRNRAGLGRDPMLEGRRVLDLAQGILIGIRRYRTEAAFEELVTVAHEHDVSVSAVAAALLALATGTAHETDVPSESFTVADRAWGDLFGQLANGAFDFEGIGKTAS